MNTIAKIIDKLQKSGGIVNCQVDCEYLNDSPLFPGIVRFTAVQASIHQNSNNCVDFDGGGIVISSNNLENEREAIEQLWEQIK